DAARRIEASQADTARLLAAVHTGSDAGGAEVGATPPEVLRAVAALVRVDPAYDRVLRKRAVLEREASGLVHALAAIGDMQRALATNGGVRPTIDEAADDARKARELREGIRGVDRQISALASGGAPAERVAPLRQELASLRARLPDASPGAGEAAGPPAGSDLSDLLRADAERAPELLARIAAARKGLGDVETALAKDALHRLDLRLSRLIRRARLGRIETVLGRKRALQVEIEAIRMGYLPEDAVDSLDAAHYLEDDEEYWPFEGDDWPDEFVGSEVR
ncbi:MAG: hypothetical protein JOZ69_06410, partial [Myxococcales bacterium]|nr:hypothetical protein [Myxococcales bacterium]